MKKWLVLLTLCALMVTGYVASGPYRTIHAIRSAVQAQDAAALSKEVDFPSLRASLKAQLTDRLIRKAGPNLQSSVFAAFGLRVAKSLIDPTVDMMVTPLGLGAIMEGRKEWSYASAGFRRPDADPPSQDPPSQNPLSQDPLRDIAGRFESPSRFTATLRDNQGGTTVVVLTRSGLNWRLSDIRLPP